MSDDRSAPVKCDCPYRKDTGKCHRNCKLFPYVVIKEKKK